MLTLKKSKLLTISFILLFIGFINKQIKAQCHIDDWTALKALYESTDGDKWTNNDGWEEVTGSTPSENCNLALLTGVGLDTQGRIESLYLVYNQLNGSIPAQLGNLSNLKSLHLDNDLDVYYYYYNYGNGFYLLPNQLSGSIPPELGNLINLESLSLYNNQLSGSIPTELGNLSNLKSLSLRDNQLSGSIPPELGNLNNLESLLLDDNQFSDNIPPELGNLSKLIYLFLTGNQHSGSIPAELGNLSNLEYLKLANNELSGNIPVELGYLSNLRDLDLSYNQLNGSIPAEIGNLSNLISMYLGNNQFSGSLPAELGNLSNLGSLNLADNNFSGCYKTALTALCSQFWRFNGVSEGNNFYADWEDFCDSEAGICFESKPNCNRDDWYALKDFYTKTNGDNWAINEGWEEVMGKKPGTGCDLSTLFGINLNTEGSVSNLNLLNNNLSGYLPPNLADLTNLKTLKIAYNNFSGCYPPILKQLCEQLSANNEAVSNGNNLNAAWEDFCLLDAGVCTKCHIEDWKALKVLYENTNGNNWSNNRGWQEITGNTPSANCNLKKLYGVNLDERGRVKSLSLYYNQLSGNIPPELGNLSNLRNLNLGGNEFSGSIPAELGNLSNLGNLNLRGNEFSGRIPAELGNLSNLDTLYLDNNQLSGSIPAELGNLSNLEFLDLTHNQLSGTIPAELGNLNNLIRLHLSSNELSGNIPSQLGNLSNLRHISLGYNKLSGNIPTQLGKLSNLLYFTLKFTQLTGNIPAELSELSNLVDLDLSYNQLSGSIPAELSNLSNLRSLDLAYNQFNGSIPAELGNLRNLSYLDLEENNFSGCYDASLAALCVQISTYRNLNKGNNFYADWKDFCDNEAGICFENKPNCNSNDWFVLKDFYTRTNGMNWVTNEGWEEIMNNKPTADCDLNTLYGISLDIDGKVSEINLSYNNLSGDITPVLADLTNLKTLKITNNNLGGCYHRNLKQLCTQLLANSQAVSNGNNLNATWEDFCLLDAGVCTKCHIEDWKALKVLYENTNGNNWIYDEGWEELTGSTPSAYCNLKSLDGVSLDEQGRVNSLWLDKNRLSGSIPVQLCNLNNLITLNLSSNRLSDSIPAQLGKLNNLVTLDLSSNKLSGSIPAQLGNLNNLKDLNLGYNQLNSSIPTQLCNLSNLEYLVLNGNQLSGSIPSKLGNLGNLEYLFLDGNQLSGNIPAQLSNLSNLSILSLSNNQLSGGIPTELGNLSIISLGLDYNQLTGNIPTQLSNLSNLWTLSLSNNQLSGGIPVELGNLSNLDYLNLGYNQLSGGIPAELGNLNELLFLDLGYNQLTGSIPAELGSIPYLENLFLKNNQLSGSIPAELSNTTFLALTVSNNYFSCADIQDNFEQNGQLYIYIPQYFKPNNYEKIELNIFDTLSIEQNLNIKIDFPFDTTGFTYQWFRNGNIISGATKAILKFDTIQPNNVGKYTLHIESENCLPNGSTFKAISLPMYVILKGYDLLGQPVEYDQIMVEFDTAEDTRRNENEILTPNAGWVKKACNCNRELYLWQFPSTETAAKALIEIDKKTKRLKKKTDITGGFNNLLKIEESQNSSLAYKVINETLSMDYTDSVVVYILDSGLDYKSLDVDASFTLNNAPIDSCYSIERNLGYSFVDSTNSTIPVSTNYQDELWHGTYGFRSITEGLNENNHLKVIPLKTFDKRGTGNLFDMTCALHHAIDNNADIINISAGYQGQPSAILEAAINEARKKGVFITAAAGNDSISIDTLAQYPAYYAGQYYTYETVDAFGNTRLDSTRYDNVISIASINENDKISRFSNVGKQSVTIAAYGENILGYGLGGDEIVALGTSMSTYFVTKELALEIALNKNRSYQQIWDDFEQTRLVANNSLEEFTQTGKHLKVKLEEASIAGCTNPNACNYFEFATIDNGTCQFSTYHPSDWAALKALYLSTNGDNWKRNNQWKMLIQDTLASPCNLNNLYGVWLNDEGRVYKINLYNNNLSGEIPAEIEGLTELTELYLAANYLVGEIPVQLTKLNKITNLILTSNNLSGPIPLEIGNLIQLERLSLSYNQFSGPIPVQIGQLNQLKYLQLDYNKLNGSIPKELAQLKKLYLLNLGNNQLSGCYQNNLENFCTQNWSPLFKNNAHISDGNSFDADWENFCTNMDGACNNNRTNGSLKLFNLYPNPSTGKLNVKLLASENKNNTLEVLNLEGKCLLKFEGKQIINGTVKLDLSQLSKGMYILKLLNEDRSYNEKFILN